MNEVPSCVWFFHSRRGFSLKPVDVVGLHPRARATLRASDVTLPLPPRFARTSLRRAPRPPRDRSGAIFRQVPSAGPTPPGHNSPGPGEGGGGYASYNHGGGYQPIAEEYGPYECVHTLALHVLPPSPPHPPDVPPPRCTFSKKTKWPKCQTRQPGFPRSRGSLHLRFAHSSSPTASLDDAEALVTDGCRARAAARWRR